MSYLKPFFILLLLTVGCQSLQTTSNHKNLDDRTLYEMAIDDAMVPKKSEIYNKLVKISPDNKNLVWKKINGEDHILMVTWKQNVSYYKNDEKTGLYNTGDYPIWVTTAPELYNRMKAEKYTDADMRLKQLLGLPPNATYSYFVEFWVNPKDLFRPCPDNEINDSECELCFEDKTDADYIAWVNANRISRYYNCELYEKYPWTQLGYTYDWNPSNTSHVGLSEFVIKTNKNIKVNKIYKTQEYLSK